ncbi:MAG: hypothetical protein RIQ81_2141 [Pseudomonadota bacterium]|jgi:type II secretion system protein N
MGRVMIDPSRALKLLGSRAGIGAIFAFSFFFFLVVTFPYDMLKESISNGLSRFTGMSISMGDFGAKLPIGFRAGDVSITGGGAKPKTLKFKSLSVTVNPVYLLAGKLALNTQVSTGDSSNLYLFLALPVGGLMKGNPVPSAVELEANKFKIDEIAAFALGTLASGPDANPLLAPVLNGIGLAAKLDGALDFSIDASAPQQSTGKVNLKFVDAVLKLSDPSLGLPDQKFNKAGIQAAMTNGILNIEKGSGFESDELTLTSSGSIAVKAPLNTSQLQIEVLVKLQKSLADKFGFLMDAFSGGAARNGELKIQVKGPLSQPSTQTM